MLILSDDKSARGQFAALITLLEKDVQDARSNREKHTKRSQDYARFTGHIEALNQTIATIRNTDVWRYAPKPPEAKHYHICNMLTKEPERMFTDPIEARRYLINSGFDASDLWTAFTQGADVRSCEDAKCLETAQNS